ncbi:MAG: protein adenylyltransferase SelO family protein, partial [Candidatus Eremiobacteraeota bacterium]|nr:protein adenylyltransferase SelO family protein [Candidatus Eremiobacteraeota bacterium]
MHFEPSNDCLGAAFAIETAPTPLPDPYLVSYNPSAAALLDLPETPSAELVKVLAGNEAASGSLPTAAVYAGHQFGSWVPQLGDGRALSLGAIRNARAEHWEVQLKGSGQTPFSRMGDGRAVLRSTIREYLCSEAMSALGIPTTRALAIVGSDDPVYRETVETAAVLTRLSPSFVRFGTFEYFYYRGEHSQLETLADLVIERHFPNLPPKPARYGAFLREVAIRTARMIAGWQTVGFQHGVMNTDNMSILGLTLDYGP